MFRQYSKTLFLMVVGAGIFVGNIAMSVLTPDFARVFEQDQRLKRLLWGVLIFWFVAAIFLFVREHNAPPKEEEKTAENLFTTRADKDNRRAMLGLVRRNWVEGVLYKLLWNEARLILNLEGRPDAVVRPNDLALRRAGQPDTYIKPGTSVLDIYRQEQEKLLLLGEPGSGKTTLLLEIAEALLQDAEKDPKLPIPVVFGLSAWRKNHTRLDEWLVEQLNRDYGIPVKIARRWVDGGALTLLLDGLDEVAESRRAECAEAINEYRLKHQKVLRPMVVCCRTREYEALPKLQLGSAVIIKPLTKQQVDGYLREGGKQLAGLRAVLKDEPALYQELFETPLMLHVAVITYEGQRATELRRNLKPEERRRRLWDAYIERMFERKQEEESLYQKQQALDWLGWLGTYLTRKNLQKYLIEGMQPNDMPHRWQFLAVRHLPALLIGIVASLLLYPDNYFGKVCMFLIALITLSTREIELQPIRHFTLRNLRQRWKTIIFRITVGTVAGMVAFGLFGAVVLGGVFGAKVGAGIGVVVGAVVGAAIMAVGELFEESVLEDTVRPNEGIHHSLRTAAVGAVVAGAIGAGLGVLLGVEFGGAFGATSGAATGAASGVILFGGNSTFQHYLLRLLLWQSGRFPRNISAFMDWSAQRVLVQRVGGGWRFVHRTLQERFSERYLEKYPDKPRRRRKPSSSPQTERSSPKDQPAAYDLTNAGD